MHPVHDIDALLLLAVALSSKRRPAALVDIVAAIDLIQGAVPGETRLAEAFTRLGRHGLISAHEADYALTPPAQAMVAELPKKAEAAERIFTIKGKLAAWNGEAGETDLRPAASALSAAILAHRAAAAGGGKNLLVPKPKPADTDRQRPGQRQRRPLPPRRRKD
ncbi:MAG: hypothetical protein HYU78_05450 [Rhodocyclales bacterium]|nr:hypothetical protein [Rhodocyclales bacterium]